MKKTVTILVGLLALLLLAQCKKEKSEDEINQELAIEAIQFIGDNLQSQFDLLSGKSTPEVMTALAEWLDEQEGVVAAVPDDHWVMITYVDGTEASIEVFDQTIMPDVANNQHSEGYDASLSEVAFLSAGKQQYSNVVGSQKVLIFDAFPHLDPEIDAGGAIYSLFQDAGCQEIEHPIEGQCTIELLRNMSQYGYIQLITHGSGTDGFATGEVVTSENCLSHLWDRANHRVRIGYFAYKYENGIEYKDKFFVVTSKFLENLRSDFDNSIVFNFACDGFVEGEGTSIKTAFLNKRAATYLGFDNENHIKHGYESSSRLVRRLLAGYTVGEAFEYVVDENWKCVDYYSEDASTGEEIFEYTTCLDMDGADDVTWYEILPIPMDGLVAYFPFNGSPDDVSGHGNNGILSGENVPTLAVDRKGHVNSAFEFGGYYNPNWIRVPNSESLVFDKEFTISFWIQHTEFAGMDGWGNYSTTGPGFAAVCKAGDGNACYPGLVISTGIGANGNGLHVGTNNSNGNSHNHDTWNHDINYDYERYQLGEWVHVAVVVENTNKILCINGLDVAWDELDKEADFTYMNQQDLYIGVMAGRNPNFGWGGGFWYPFYGKIDDVRIYNRALNPLEVKALYSE